MVLSKYLNEEENDTTFVEVPTCTICTDDINPCQQYFPVSCGHTFHHWCALNYASHNLTNRQDSNCPNCRSEKFNLDMMAFEYHYGIRRLDYLWHLYNNEMTKMLAAEIRWHLKQAADGMDPSRFLVYFLTTKLPKNLTPEQLEEETTSWIDIVFMNI